MLKYLTVNDFKPTTAYSKEAFKDRIPHPFLVLLSMPEEIQADLPKAFFNTQVALPNMDKLAAIAEGKMLDPQSLLFPVKKRGVSASEPGVQSAVVMLGRAENSDIVIACAAVSKSHCYISPKPFCEDRYTLSDNGSTNGTWLNDKPVSRNERAILNSGDKITLGREVSLRFYLSTDFWQKLQASFV